MKITKLAVSLLVGIGTGCTTVPPASTASMPNLPNCFDTNYDEQRRLFTIKNDAGNPVNQQCLITVGPGGDIVSEVLGGIWDAVTGLFTERPRGGVASATRLTPGSYTVYLSNGGGGGAGGTLQSFVAGGGGGGGGGAGAAETRATVTLTEGVYKLTLGAGGPGGTACMPGVGFGGGAGWVGSPSNMVRVATGEVVIGTSGADTYARLSRAQSERSAGKMDAHGGSGPGQASGGHGAVAQTKASGLVAATPQVEATAGASLLASGRSGVGGARGGDFVDDKRSGVGGGGGATMMGHGGAGSGETAAHKDTAPVRGSLGSGGGGGEGGAHQCDPGARGGHGYIALRPM